MPSNKGLVGRPRRRLTAAVRERHAPCSMCGLPIDQTRDRTNDPLGSVVDEWVPRRPPYNGDPLDPTNCTEQHRVCNGVKGGRWPVTEEMRTRCRTLVATAQANQHPTLTRTW